eukprot:4851084-Prorocentrum_lima.AAC.1
MAPLGNGTRISTNLTYGTANWIMGGCRKYMRSWHTATSKPTTKHDSVSASSGKEGHMGSVADELKRAMRIQAYARAKMIVRETL